VAAALPAGEKQLMDRRAVLEAFINGRQCVALRVYPGREDSIGVSLRCQGQDAVLKSLDAWQMKNIHKWLACRHNGFILTLYLTGDLMARSQKVRR
jgi:hypothetical protein